MKHLLLIALLLLAPTGAFARGGGVGGGHSFGGFHSSGSFHSSSGSHSSFHESLSVRPMPKSFSRPRVSPSGSRSYYYHYHYDEAPHYVFVPYETPYSNWWWWYLMLHRPDPVAAAHPAPICALNQRPNRDGVCEVITPGSGSW